MASLTISKSFNHMMNNGRVDNRGYNKDEEKGLSNFAAFLKMPIGADYLIFNAKRFFNFLWNLFIQASVHHYFNLKYFIHIETNAFRNNIDKVLKSANFK